MEKMEETFNQPTNIENVYKQKKHFIFVGTKFLFCCWLLGGMEENYKNSFGLSI